jgi:hypothetical protein
MRQLQIQLLALEVGLKWEKKEEVEMKRRR